MADLFYSPRLTLVRAEYHIRDFNSVVDDFVKGKPWTIFVDRDSEPGKDLIKIKFTKPLPDMLPCMLFDAASNLRAALDQAGYAAALASGKIVPGKPKRPRTNFPFADTLPNLDNHIDNRGACEDLPPEIITLFRGFSPYKGGANDPLWALNELCNTKKHCRLVPLQINKALAFFTGEIVGEGWTTQVVSPPSTGLGWDPGKNEITLMSVITKPGTKANIEADVAFDVAIDGIETLGRERARYDLAALSGIVQRILAATEAECRGLGFKLD